jgi:hypothetical protein
MNVVRGVTEWLQRTHPMRLVAKRASPLAGKK